MGKSDALRILVVEDDAAFRETVREILRDMGYKVRGARNLNKAVKRLTHHSFDLVLSDLEIGDGTGLDVLEVARSTHPDAPIVLMSGNANPDMIKTAIDSGAARFLPKPFGIKELIQTVNNVLDERQTD